jgi:hypothetical protein
MRTIASCAAVLLLALAARAQVITIYEIKDPAARLLQERYLPQLNEIGTALQAHKFPYPFYFSRRLDIDEKGQQKLDQRSIRFEKFNGRMVLEITGNYYAAYADALMDRRARTRKTYEDVVLPLLKTTVPRFPPADDFAGFAIEVSYHVRRNVMNVQTENPENLTFIVTRAAAHHLVSAANEEQEQAALLESELYVDAEPFVLWLKGEPPADTSASRTSPPAKVQLASASAPFPLDASPAPEPAVSEALLKGTTMPMRLITPDIIAGLKKEHADTIERMVGTLDEQAHFVKYAPPAFVAFHQGAYLQLSLTSPLAASNGSRYQLAALAFDDHISHLVRPVLAYFPQDGGFDGISFSTTLKLPAGDSTEAVEFFFPFQAMRCFAAYDCTGQQLIESGIVLINGERAGLNLAAAEAGAGR